MKENKAIILVGFGTSDVDAIRRCIEPIEDDIREIYGKEYTVFKAFTSKIILRKLKKDFGIEILDFKEALRKSKEVGCKRVIIVPLNVIAGGEYDRIKEFVSKYEHEFEELILGKPILQLEDEAENIVYSNIFESIKNELPRENNLLLVGHGISNKSNIIYKIFQKELEKLGFDNVILGTLEGEPCIEEIIDKLKIREVKEITLMPFLAVSGMHVKRDIFGDQEESWKSRLEREGFKVNCLDKALTEFPNVKELYVDNLKNIIS
ncbi:sirohydrochlorin cobaltochelatase [Clostridium sp. CTA-5]